jgi:hypothetical protein
MAQLSTILDRVHDELPAVPELVALRALADSAKEFCKRTHYWQDTLPAVRTKIERTTYDLSTDAGVMVVAVKDVRNEDGLRIPPYAGELVHLLVTPLTSGAALGWVQRTPTTLELVNAPATVERLTVRAALTLVQGATEAELPDDLLNEYAEPIGAGAKMRLVKMVGLAWSAPEFIPQFAAAFYAGVNDAKRRTMTSLGSAELQVQMRSW